MYFGFLLSTIATVTSLMAGLRTTCYTNSGKQPKDAKYLQTFASECQEGTCIAYSCHKVGIFILMQHYSNSGDLQHNKRLPTKRNVHQT